MLFSELRCKQVINLKDCKCLGRVNDLEFDECSGQICKIIVSNGNRFACWFNNEPEYIICFKDIKKIGPDIIIVDIGR
ncbi:PRC-barrel domain-containing protein [Kineothrix sp. MB12-C1]|uniref:PRC-barrel domain-containing protein n=1 Tax=Kineothrix sp. MB12-C1 TaxID=3070215 RepID=UPI0027D256E8|nr:YlmC/YmxH family sporulation protein [Kineothrix sp. MB12-C1]WMC92234.1 YlmC/YmxH family sporulation protein [Kineothrix sp. MB12-C1]